LFVLLSYNGQKITDKRTNNDLQNTTGKDRHYNGQKITDKRTNNDLQNTTEKDRHYNGQKITDKRTCLSFCLLSFDHCNVCPSL
jgi:cytosine/uracil/thiamine/allantoin permease